MSNYFTLFNIQPKYDIDLNLLERRYIELSKTLHPDNASDSKKSAAVENAININKAYQILRSPLKRAEYLLSLLNTKKNCNVDPEILEESMQIREFMLSSGASRQVLTGVIEDKMKECIENLKSSFAKKDLNEAAAQLHRLKYLNKSHEEIK